MLTPHDTTKIGCCLPKRNSENLPIYIETRQKPKPNSARIGYASQDLQEAQKPTERGIRHGNPIIPQSRRNHDKGEKRVWELPC
jgi:hypothetical protein